MVTQFAWQVAASILLGLVVDQWLGTAPWGTLILAMSGLVSAVWGLIRTGLAALPKGASKGRKSE
jgi:F0F1-type ATP synthase assembly protein I